VELGKGKKVPEICRLLEVTEQTYYRWRQKYGGNETRDGQGTEVSAEGK
jgi:transposase-like protein